MRTGKAIKNIIVSLLMGFAVIIINFIAQRIFINNLGIEYLGLNGLFTNVVAVLAVAELGLGSAIVYHLYAPLHKKDVKKVSSIMRFYKNGYRIVALTILVAGICIIPLLPSIVGENSIKTNLTLVFGLFVINAAASYLMSYKRSLLYADQKSYIINIVHFGALVILNMLQIWVLITTQNYYLYLILKILMTLVENVILNYVIDQQYSLDKSPQSLSMELRRDIFKKINGLLYHKISGLVLLGSSNVIISIFLGVATVGLYSNYLLIQTALYSIFFQIAGAVRASIGNLLVSETRVASSLVFDRLHFAGQVLSVVSVCVFLIVSDGFVTQWIGEQYVLSFNATAALSISIYLYLIRLIAYNNFKEAAGIFYEDRYIPLIEACVGIIASIVLVQYIGLSGVFLGTALSSTVLYGYSYPKYVYKGILGRGYKEYIMETLKYISIAFSVIAITYYSSLLVTLDTVWLQLALDLGISILVPLILLWVILGRTSECRYYYELMKKGFKVPT